MARVSWQSVAISKLILLSLFIISLLAMYPFSLNFLLFLFFSYFLLFFLFFFYYFFLLEILLLIPYLNLLLYLHSLIH
ncbi:MAG TPA: hypothetical protein EYP82_05695 [Hydrogenothermaceae bacterium]|nr:hypothetical protein [Hydrogenothermaceae bacterium]